MRSEFLRKLLGRRQRDPRYFLLGRLPRHSVCAEIGVYKGDFSEMVLDVVKPKVLHLIDPWKYEPHPTYTKSWYGGTQGADQAHMDSIYDNVKRRFKREIQSGMVCIHRLPSAEASTEFPEGHFDWVYIDGNHLYDFVKNDLELYYPKVKAGGIIAGDDYETEGWWGGGIRKAVEEFITTGRCSIVLIRNNQFALRKAELGSGHAQYSA